VTRRRSDPFWQIPEREDQDLSARTGHLSVIFVCALLLTSGRPVLALCGSGLFLFHIWGLLSDTVEPRPTYGLLRFLAELLKHVLILSLFLFVGLMLLPALLLATAFPGLLWFSGALVLAGSVASGLVRALHPLGAAHLIASGLGIALALLLRSPWPLAASVLFLGVFVAAWTRMSRRDFGAFVLRFRPRSPSSLSELDETEQDAERPADEISTVADEPFPPDAFTFPLSAWVACHLEGRTANHPETLLKELSRPLPEDRLPLCRRILAHAVQFQEGPFIRELVQNVLDEAARIGAGPWRRVLEIDCRAAGDHLLEIEVADLLGMSFETVVNDLLVPNRTSKSVRDWGTIGRFGQGFFTALREAESVRVRSFQRTAAGGGWDLDVLLTPVWNDGRLHDITVALSSVWLRNRSRLEGTAIAWRGRPGTGDDFVVRAWEEVRDTLQNIPADELFIRLNGEMVNQPSSNYARIPTPLGPLLLLAQEADDKDLLITKNNLLLTRISRQSFRDFFPEAPEHFADFLFAGGIVLDLPPGLPVNRTRNAIAGRERFAGSLSRDVVRACLLAEIEFALRLRVWPSSLRRKGVISDDPSDWCSPEKTRKWRKQRSTSWYDFLSRSALPTDLGKRIAAGENFLKELRDSLRSNLLLSVPCIPDRLGTQRRSLSQIAGVSWASLFRYALPFPSRPVHATLSSLRRPGLLGRLARLMRSTYRGSCKFATVACGLLLLAIPFLFLGQQVGLWAIFAFVAYLFARVGIQLVYKTLLAMAAPIGEVMSDRPRLSVWDALGSIARDGALLLLQESLQIPESRPGCRLYQRPSKAIAFAPQGGGLDGVISWNAHHMKKGWDIRNLRSYLRSGGDRAAIEEFQLWLSRFLFVLTHESAHLLEKKGSTTHEEVFYRRQRRLLEKVLRRESDFMALFEREALRSVRWTWSPAWIFLVRRNAERREWEWVKES
jgi:hypothetical protein